MSSDRLLLPQMTLKRINRELSDIKKEDLGAMKLSPTEENMFLWKGTIPGPEGSVYEGGLFDIEVLLPPDYPYVIWH
jgi:ubiquitin-protein ligase